MLDPPRSRNGFIQIPVLLRLALALGISPIQLGIILLANLEVGYLTPPTGLNLLLSSYRFSKPIPERLRLGIAGRRHVDWRAFDHVSAIPD